VTRINVGIDPAELPTKLLLAEHRELKRIPNMVRENRVNLTGIPARFTLGTGHVKFFYNKLGYLKDRYHKIYNECVSRECNVQYYGGSFEGIPENLMSEYSHSDEDRELLIKRIHLRGFKLLSE
jgi:hypothetical protein